MVVSVLRLFVIVGYVVNSVGHLGECCILLCLRVLVCIVVFVIIVLLFLLWFIWFALG